MPELPSAEDLDAMFDLYPYDQSRIGNIVKEHVAAGLLPIDIFFRLASIGYLQPDATSKHRLSWSILTDLAENAGHPELMQDATLEILEGGLPDAIIDWQIGHNVETYNTFEHMYYRVGNLASVISERRLVAADNGEERKVRSRAVAKGLWRSIVNRHHPEWLKDPSQYYAPTISFAVVHDAGERTMRRRIINHAILGDPLVLGTFEEAIEFGVRGIGPKGKESLKALLSEEHPELI